MVVEGLSSVTVGCHLKTSTLTWGRGQKEHQSTALTMTETMSHQIVNGQHHRNKIEIDVLIHSIKQELLVFVGLRGTGNGKHTYGLMEGRKAYTQEMIFLRLVAGEDMRKIIMVILFPETMYNPCMVLYDYFLYSCLVLLRTRFSCV